MNRTTKNHTVVNGQLLQVNKKFSQLKQTQKEKIAQWLNEEYENVFGAGESKPGREADEKIVGAVMNRIAEQGIWIPESEVWFYYRSRKDLMPKGIEKRQEEKMRGAV